jgi:hypothetical protein
MAIGDVFRNVIGHMGIIPASRHYGDKAKGAQADEQRRATTEQANLRLQMDEDRRTRGARLGTAMMNRVPATTGDGSIRTNAAIDPAVLADLARPRTGTAPGAKEVARGDYDFGAAIPDSTAGSGDAFLAGLFGEMGDIGLRTLSGGAAGMPDAGGGPDQLENISIEDLMALADMGGDDDSMYDEFPEK